MLAQTAGAGLQLRGSFTGRCFPVGEADQGMVQEEKGGTDRRSIRPASRTIAIQEEWLNCEIFLGGGRSVERALRQAQRDGVGFSVTELGLSVVLAQLLTKHSFYHHEPINSSS